MPLAGIVLAYPAKNPTVALIMEVNDWWVRQLSGLKKDYLYCFTFPAENAYGMALYSKLPLKNPDIRFLNHDKVPSFTMNITLPDSSRF
ncbi:endonuclease/exonuclease/phosphatase family protein [Spirosoma fluminis]